MGVGLVSRIKIMAGMNIVERRRPQDGQLTTTIDGKDIDVRVATVATIWGEKCVLRILDKNRSVLRLDDLGMPTDTHETYSKLVRAPFGMVLCAGPTGSGKTTTLYATLDRGRRPHPQRHDDRGPGRVRLPLHQPDPDQRAGRAHLRHRASKSILRQDPDVILVGEIRDVETARIAVQSALTGHLVLSSLHATDSVSALHRFLDMGIESFLIASSVIADRRPAARAADLPVVQGALHAHRRRSCAFYEESGGPPKTRLLPRARAATSAADTGYQDRIGVYELLQMTPEIKRLIVGWATQDELRRLAAEAGHAHAAQRGHQPGRAGHHDRSPK